MLIPVVNHDYPTLLEATGIKPDPLQTLTGFPRSLLGKPKCRSQASLIALPTQAYFLGGVSAATTRDGDWKLIEYFDPARPEKFELFDLKRTPRRKKTWRYRNPNG